jgi:hypothetical protein
MFDRKISDKKYSETHKKQKHEWYLKNKERLLLKFSQKYEKCKDIIKKYNKNYAINHSEQIKINNQEYRKNHKEEAKIYQKNYTAKHKLEKREYDRNYQKNKRLVNVEYRLMMNFRRRLSKALKGNPKLSTTMKLIGCSIKELKAHLEVNFELGMNWSNYGKNGWVIDHIKPCALFDMKKESEQKLCFHYTNLQPLWEKDNLKKSDNYPQEKI